MKTAFELPNALTINGEVYCSSEAVGAHGLWEFIETGKLVIEGRIYSRVNYDRLMAGQTKSEFFRSTGYDLAKVLGSPELAHEIGLAQQYDADYSV